MTEPTDPKQIDRPIDQYLLGPQVVLHLVRAERARQIECLRGLTDDRSIDWPLDEEAVLEFVEGGAGDEIVRSDLWGFFDPQNASRLGYSRPGDQAGALQSGVPQGVSSDDFAECSIAVHGAFPLGSGGGALSAGNVSSLPDGGPPVATGDSRVEAVVDEWSACMTKRGFEYPDPVTAMVDSWQPGVSSVSAGQIATATADMDCKAETNLVGIELAVQSAYDQQYIDSHREALVQLADVVADYIGGEPGGADES